MDVSITPAAEKFIKRILRFDGGPDSGFRLVVTPGGCSGLASEFSVASAPQAGDAVVELSGMKFFMPAETRVLLTGVTIDFSETPTQSGLVFHDPKAAASSCSSASPNLPGTASIDISSIARRH
jgi:iron-sulfur cluster assembly protein